MIFFSHYHCLQRLAAQRPPSPQELKVVRVQLRLCSKDSVRLAAHGCNMPNGATAQNYLHELGYFGAHEGNGAVMKRSVREDGSTGHGLSEN
jgi:hypothetical protein